MKSAFWSILALLMVGGSSGLGADDAETSERDAHRAKMTEVARSIQLAAGESETPIPLATNPILYYSDPTRDTADSALWIWGDAGRPAAVMATELYPSQAGNPHWLYEIASVSESRISASHESGLDWSAEQPGLALRPIPDAGTPDDRPSRRLSQMKQLLRRFAVYETATIEGRIELRAMANPVHRYEDQNAGLTDGAIFVFANGSNPEVLVLLEVHAMADGSVVWMYSLARMTGEAVSVSLDDEEVWTRDGTDVPTAQADYVNGRIAAD